MVFGLLDALVELVAMILVGRVAEAEGTDLR